MKILLILAVLCPLPAFANGTCSYPSNTSGCPGSAPATQGVTTPTAIPNTAFTINGVTTASVDIVRGLPFVTNGYNAPSGGAQSSEDITIYGPHEAFSANQSTYEIIFCQHQGGGSTGGVEQNGCFGDGTVWQENIFEVQRFLGTPNRVGGKGIILVLCNYLLTNWSLSPSGPNPYPQQWKDAKCALWFALAQANTIVPGNRNLVGLYGPSWGGVMIWWMAGTPDTLYSNSSCLASAPGSPPTYVIVPAWSPQVWTVVNGNALCANGNTQSQHAMIGQFNAACGSAVDTACAAFSPTCDPDQNITNTYASTYANLVMLWQYGTSGSDLTVPPVWGSGATYGGEMVQTINAFASLSKPYHPFFQIIPGGHVSDIGTIASPSQADAFNFLLGQAQPITSGGLGGNL